MKISRGYRFKNWARNIKNEPKYYCQPETEQEIIELIQKYDKIRVVGSGHSWSALCESEELLINLDKLNNVLLFDKKQETIRVQAGIKLEQLNTILDKEGFALINLGSIAKQSLAGAIATGTHGSGINFQCLASQVEEFSIINAEGKKINYKKGDAIFNAIIIGLGCFGIITEMTLKVSKAFRLHDQTYTSSFEDVIEQIDSYLEYDHFKLWWLPPTKEVVVYTYTRTQEKRNDSSIRKFLKDDILSVLGYRTLVKVGNLVNKWRNPINRLLTQQMKGPLDRIEKSYLVFNVPEPPKHRETEWAFDIKNAKEILKGYQQLFTETDFTFNFIQEIRFTKGDDFWLSECYGRDTIWIGAYNHQDKQWPNILKTFESFAKQHHGRPHWGKEFDVNRDYLEANYPKYKEFIALKEQMDPELKFSNAIIQQLFS